MGKKAIATTLVLILSLSFISCIGPEKLVGKVVNLDWKYQELRVELDSGDYLFVKTTHYNKFKDKPYLT